MDHDRREVQLRKMVGCADICELLTAAFSFPDEPLAAALADGSFVSDAVLCMEDIGADSLAVSVARETLAPFAGSEPAELLDALRKSYSLLYLVPGGTVPVFPYEAAFLFVAQGRTGTPALFRSPVTLDVEAHFSEAGVIPANVRKEPCDSVFSEFTLLSYLYAKFAEAVRLDDAVSESLWSGRLDAFVDQHALRWLPAFMEQTLEVAGTVTGGKAYVSLARFGAQMLRMIFPEISSGDK